METMKIKNLILLTSFFLLGSQVMNSQSKMSNLPVFDLSKEYPLKKMCLQDMADIEYVPLETTDDILLGGAAKLSAITNKYILIYELQLGDIFVFDRNTGKLYSHFNHKGQSGVEYSWIKNGTILDEKKEEIYVCSQYIQVYSLKGEYKRTLKINGFENDMKILNFDEESLLIYDDVFIEPGRENKTKKKPYRLVSKKDSSLFSVLGIHFPKRISNTIVQTEGKKWRTRVMYYSHNMYYGSDIIIADISSDTLYQLSATKGLIPLLTRKPSVYASDPPNIWTPFLTTDKFMLIGTFLLDFNAPEGRIPTFIYDFKTGEINKASIWDTEYETKSWRQGRWGGPNGTPAIAKNMAAELIQASSVIDAYKNKQLKGNGEKVAKNLQEDDNPVVRIFKFK